MDMIAKTSVAAFLFCASSASAGFVFGSCDGNKPPLVSVERAVCECSLLENTLDQLDCFDEAKAYALRESRFRCESLSLQENDDYWCTHEGELSRLMFECGGDDPVQRLSCYLKVAKPDVLLPASYLRISRELASTRWGRQSLATALEESSD